MKKIKSKFSLKQKNFIKELLKLHKTIIMDLLVDNFSQTDLSILFKLDKDYNENILKVFTEILDFSEKGAFYFNKLQKINKSRTEKYMSYSIEELKEEFEKDYFIPERGDGIAPEMILLYYNSNNLPKDSVYAFCEDFYLKTLENYDTKQDKKLQEIYNDCTQMTSYMIELEHYLNGKYMGNISDEELYKKFLAEKIEDGYKVRRGLLEFTYKYLEQIFETHYKAEKSYILLRTYLQKIATMYEEWQYKTIEISSITKENQSLKNKVELLQRELELSLEKKIIVTNDKDLIERNKELEKENYYLKYQNEKLQLRLQELENELNINKTIVEELEILQEIPPKTPKMNPKSIVVLGGKWTYEKIKSSKLPITFIRSEDILKSISGIKKYDLIIFDTSRNSHIFFNKLKSVTHNFYLISHSSIEEIQKIIQG